MSAVPVSPRVLQRRAVILRLLDQHPCPIPVGVLAQEERWQMLQELVPASRTIFLDLRALTAAGLVAAAGRSGGRQYRLAEAGKAIVEKLRSDPTALHLLDAIQGDAA